MAKRSRTAARASPTGRTRATPATAALADRFTPQLATLVKAPPEGDAWLHELKYDGYRIGCRIDGSDVRLLSRNGKDWTERFGSVRDAASRLGVHRAFLDGEVAVVLPDGRTSFQALQHAFAANPAGGQLVYFLFDLLHLDGEDVSRLALEERKARLQKLLARRPGTLRFADHLVGRGAQILDEACRQRAEGIVSKRRDLPYQPGRGTGWVKAKCVQRQEFVIGGFTDPEGSRAGLGALLIGVRDAAARLVFAGKVGTGFSQASARELRARLEALAQPECPFATRPPGGLGRNAHWVRPDLVAEVAFTEWTEDGKVRHPSFQGLRADKRTDEVIRERAATVPQPGARAGDGGLEGSGMRKEETKTAGKRKGGTGKEEGRSRGAAKELVVAGVKLTHPDRILFPDVGIDKGELALFYEGIADWVIPHIKDRPLTLVRCPDGVGGSCFYMKHSKVWAPPGLRRVAIREKTKVGEYLVADSLTGLIGLVQMDVLEIHTWNSTATRVEQPDRIVIDLDPGPAVEWPAVITAARLVRGALDGLGLQCFVKTTGGRGLHVVTPIAPGSTWDACLAFARALAEAIVRLDPPSYTTAFAKAGRERQILIDYLRNNRTNTSVAAFSTRARAAAPLSIPLTWDELSPRLRSDHYTVRNVGKRLARLRADPWQAYWSARQSLPKDALRRLEQVR